MKRQSRVWSLLIAIGCTAIIVTPNESAYARGRFGGFHGGGFRGGGFGHGDFGRGAFSREGPAAAGSFASRAGSMFGHEGGMKSGALAGEANRMEQANRMQQANRMAYGEHAQASRQQEANSLQSSREQTAQSMQNSAQQYRGNYPYGGVGYPAWDAGAGWAAAATGAAVGAAATAAAVAPATATVPYAADQPCANAVTVPVGPDTFFRCGSTWYRQAYGPAGPTFVAVRPPGL